MSANKTYTFTVYLNKREGKHGGIRSDMTRTYSNQESDGEIVKYFNFIGMSVQWARRYGGYEIECICEQTKERVDY